MIFFSLITFLVPCQKYLSLCFFFCHMTNLQRECSKASTEPQQTDSYTHICSVAKDRQKNEHNVHLNKQLALHEQSQSARAEVVITTASSAQLKRDGYIPGNSQHTTKYSMAGSKISVFQFEGTVRKGSTLSGCIKSTQPDLTIFGPSIYVCKLPAGTRTIHTWHVFPLLSYKISPA